MQVQLELAEDVALVLFEMLARGVLSEKIEAPERNALCALEASLETRLVASLSGNYRALLEQARESLVARYGS